MELTKTAEIVAGVIGAKVFLQKLINPPLETIGDIIASEVKLFQFRRQIALLTKAEKYLSDKGIKSKKISLKMLVPLLEESSLEEDETLHDMWAKLLANTVREDSAITTTLFSHVLSQITREEAELFESIVLRDKLAVGGTTKHHKILNEIDKIEHMKKSQMMLDNLYRLRLIKEAGGISFGANTIIVTQLGYSFYEACSFT